MQLAIFGATGTVGGELVSQALAAGHHVRTLARTASKLGRDDPDLDVVCGDVMDLGAVAQTIGDADAVLSTLGATATDHPHTRRTGTKNIIAGSPAHMTQGAWYSRAAVVAAESSRDGQAGGSNRLRSEGEE